MASLPIAVGTSAPPKRRLREERLVEGLGFVGPA